MTIRIGFKILEKQNDRHVGYVKDSLMNLTHNVKSAYTESVKNPYEFKARLRFFEKNLNTILSGKSIQFKALCENIRESNYRNFKEGELVVAPVYPSELNKK